MTILKMKNTALNGLIAVVITEDNVYARWNGTDCPEDCNDSYMIYLDTEPMWCATDDMAEAYFEAVDSDETRERLFARIDKDVTDNDEYVAVYNYIEDSWSDSEPTAFKNACQSLRDMFCDIDYDC